MVDEHEIHRFEGEGGKVVELHGTWSPESGLNVSPTPSRVRAELQYDRPYPGPRSEAAKCVRYFETVMVSLDEGLPPYVPDYSI